MLYRIIQRLVPSKRERDGVFVPQNIMKLNPALCPQDAGRLKYCCLGKIKLLIFFSSIIFFQLNSLWYRSQLSTSQILSIFDLNSLSWSTTCNTWTIPKCLDGMFVVNCKDSSIRTIKWLSRNLVIPMFYILKRKLWNPDMDNWLSLSLLCFIWR